MANKPGWISLLVTVRERFEALVTDSVTLTLYVYPFDQSKMSEMEFPEPLQEQLRAQRLGGGCLTPGSLFLNHSWFWFFANPIPPTIEYRNFQVIHYSKLSEVCKEAWSLLPSDLRRMSVGNDELAGWIVIVFRILMVANIGIAKAGPNMAAIEGDFAKASTIAIRLLEQNGIGAIFQEPPSEVKPLSNWLAPRAKVFQEWLTDQTKQFPLPYIHEINDLFGPPMSGPPNVLNYWICSVQPNYIRFLISNSHSVLSQLGIELPPWQEEPLDQTWGDRASGHVAALLKILNAQINPDRNPKRQKESGKSPDKVSDRQLDILRYLLGKNAIDVESRQLTSEIADAVLGKNVGADTLKRPISELKKLGLIDTKTGSGGGCWLSPHGIAIASKNKSPKKQ